MQRGDAEVDEGVGAALIRTTVIGGGGDRGERIDGSHHRRSTFSREQGPQLGHAVLAGTHAHPAFGHRVGALFLNPRRIQRVDRAAHEAFELGQRLPTRPSQHPILHRDRGVRVEG